MTEPGAEGANTGRAARIGAIIDEAVRCHEQLRERDVAPVLAAVDAVRVALERGGKVLVFGNGGSANDAQHLAAELVGRFARERRAFAAIALSADPGLITAIGNDYGIERVFARQVEALGTAADVAIAITTSGTSPNVLAGVEVAQGRGLMTIALTGRDGGPVGAMVDVHINVPERSVARTQEVHRTVIHVLCELIEDELSAGSD